MKVSQEDLLAYVDGNLSAARREDVECAIAGDPEAAQMVAAFEASKLPFRAAYESTPMAPLPKPLRRTVEGWAAISKAAEMPAPKPAYRIFQIAASVFLGVIIGYLLGNGLPVNGDAAIAQSKGATAEETAWVRLVADYQSLYVPETVANISNPRKRAEALFTRLALSGGPKAAIPDLYELGYRFMRAQQLGYRGSPLIQLVYKKGEDRLLALCFMRDRAPDRDGGIEVIGEQATLSWRENGQRFVIVSQDTKADLHAVQALTRKTWM